MMNNQLQQGDDNYYSDDQSYSSYYSDDAIVNSDDETIQNDDDYLDDETKEWLKRNQFNRRQKEKEQNVSTDASDDMISRPPVNMSVPLINPWNKKEDSKDCPIMSLTDIMESQTRETEEEKLRIEEEKRQKQEQAKKKRSFHFGNNSSSTNTSSSGNSTKPRFNLKHKKNSREEGASKPRFITKKKV